MEIQERICRLCLKICDNFKPVEGVMKNFLNVLLPKIDLAAIRGPVTCASCTDILTKCFNFKMACFDTFDFIVPFANNTNDAKVDLRDVYLIKNESGTGVPEGHDLCGFCMDLVKNCSAIPLNFEDIMLKKMVEQCLPELDLSIIRNPVICEPCHESLGNCFHFVMNFLTVEEKVKKYCETVDTNSEGQIELTNLIQFPLKDEVDSHSVDLIKPRKQVCGVSENAEEEDVDCEDKSFMDICEEKFNDEQQLLLKNTMKEESNNGIRITETFCGENKPQRAKENLIEIEDQKSVKEEIKIKTEECDFSSFENDVSPQPEATGSLRRGQKCLMQNPEENLSKPSTLKSRRDPSEIAAYKCNSCSFQAKHKHHLKRHSLIHKDPSEITMYKCNSCSYQTKDKYHLAKHSLVHKDPSEITMYKCNSCACETKDKYYIKRHLSLHKNPSEVTVYKCNYCSCQTKDKYYIKRHLLIHKDSSEVMVYKCNCCSYKTTEKYALKKHLLVHMDASEVAMYKCSSCSYQAKQRSNLNKHLLVHRNRSEVAVFKCNSCPYKAKRKGDLKSHSLVHEDSSLYKCNSCPYQSKWKCALKKHLSVHRDAEEEATYKCNSCSYQTRQKGCLKRHLLLHK